MNDNVEFKVNNLLDRITDIGFDNLKLYLISRKKENIISINPSIKQEVQKTITNDIIKKRLEYYNGRSLKEYNITGANDETVEKIDINCLNEYWKPILDSMNKPQASLDINPSDYDFIIYQLGNEDNSIYFFRKSNKLKTLKKGMLGNIINGKFSKIESSKLIGIDNDIDFVIDGTIVYIFNHISIERVFKLANTFKENAAKILSNGKLSQKIKNFEAFKEDALKNRNYIKRLAKLNNTKSTFEFLEKIDKTKKVIDHFNLEIEVTDDNKLIYNEKAQLGDFINLMQDAYYRTLIGGQEGIDEKR